MINLNPEICRKLRDARRAAKLSQSELAEEVGCKQSALSMFEQGQPTKLNDDVVEKLAKKFDIDLTEKPKRVVASPTMPFVSIPSASVLERGYCPNPACPSNHIFQVDGRNLAKPDRVVADPVGGKFCAMCGEILEKKCPNCGAPVHEGAICSLCGEPYIVV